MSVPARTGFNVKIWILEIGEPLPIEPNARLHRYGVFSKWLAEHGHDVTWWTSSFSHTPKKNFVEEDCEVIKDGVRLKFIFGKGYPRNISFSRIKHQAEFASKFLVQAEAYLAGGGTKPDVIMAPIPTVDGAAAAVKFGFRHSIPVIADIRDLWPDEIRDLAPTFARLIVQVALSGAYKKLRAVCVGASAICGVSKSYLEYGLKYADRKQSTDFVFPLGYSVQKLSPEKLEASEKWFQTLKIPQAAFVSCFFGTIGQFFDLSTVIRSARELGENYYFILGGDGSSLEDFRKEALGLKNVIFTGWLDAAQIQTVMKHSHAGLAPYAKHAKMSLPNKPFEYMSAGLPVVSSIQYELKDILATNKAGVTYVADSGAGFNGALKILKNDLIRAEYGKNARDLFEREFDSEKVFATAIENIRKVVEQAHA